jgi:hypothetical protein
MKVSASPTTNDKTVTADVTSATATGESTPSKPSVASGSDGQTEGSFPVKTTVCFTLASVKNDTFDDEAVTGSLVVSVQKAEGEGFTFGDKILANLNHGDDVLPMEGNIVPLKDDDTATDDKWEIKVNVAWDAEANKLEYGNHVEPATACAADLLKLINLEGDKREPIRLEFFTKAAMDAEGEDKKSFLILSAVQADANDATKGTLVAGLATARLNFLVLILTFSFCIDTVSPSADESKEDNNESANDAKTEETEGEDSPAKKPAPADPKEKEATTEESEETAEEKKEDKNPTPPKKQKIEEENEEEKNVESSA